MGIDSRPDAEKLSELLSHCIRCGFCLEACPTFAETGSELESPRGRIYLVRSALEGKLNWQEDIKPHLDACLGCRACETACPSGVKYGEILELSRNRLEHGKRNVSKRALLESTTRPWILKSQLTLSRFLADGRVPAAVSRALAHAPAEVDMPRAQGPAGLPILNESYLPAIRGEVYVLEGCAMKVLFGRVRDCTKRLLRRAGFLVREVEQGCCGALHAHNGYLSVAGRMATKLMSDLPGDLPIIVDSAGCGSAMKEYAALLPDTPAAKQFSERVFDLSEFLVRVGFEETLRKSPGLPVKVAYHEACHLIHGQRISAEPKSLIAAIPEVTLQLFAEADMCCGSAGIYNLLQPAMARSLIERKWSNIAESLPDCAVTGNPGCHAWLAQVSREHGGTIPVLHTAEMLEASFTGLDHFTAGGPAIQKGDRA